MAAIHAVADVFHPFVIGIDPEQTLAEQPDP